MECKHCRFCNSLLSKTFLNLGTSPLSNSYLNSEQLTLKESFFPLHAFVCQKCFLVQLEEFQTPKDIFSNYVYFSSYSTTWLEHAKDYVKMMISRFKINIENNVIEIASNDGYLLQFFQEKNIPVLGIEPAKNVAKIAKKKGIPTMNEFFGEKTAIELSESKKKADILIGNNVLAHVPNLNDFIKGLKILLNSGGVITLEFPHILQLIQYNQFDTIYHEHFSYFSFITIQKILAFHKLNIFDVEELSTHGGSLRIFVCHDDEEFLISNNVELLIQKEQKFELDKIETYVNFQQNINHLKNILHKFFVSTKKENKTVVGFGAPAKGNTLLNFCKIGTNFLDYVVDNNPHKQGLYMPGSHIPIKSPEEIMKTKPDFILILPWNIKEEIMKDISFIHDWNGKFVIPIPKVIII